MALFTRGSSFGISGSTFKDLGSSRKLLGLCSLASAGSSTSLHMLSTIWQHVRFTCHRRKKGAVKLLATTASLLVLVIQATGQHGHGNLDSSRSAPEWLTAFWAPNRQRRGLHVLHEDASAGVPTPKSTQGLAQKTRNIPPTSPRKRASCRWRRPHPPLLGGRAPSPAGHQNSTCLPKDLLSPDAVLVASAAADGCHALQRCHLDL